MTSTLPAQDPRATATTSRYFQPEIETAPRAEIVAGQEERLRALLPYAYERAPFYRELWDAAGVDVHSIRTLADFATLPTFTKDDARAYRDRTGDAFAGRLCVGMDELTSVTSSSGSTGQPEMFAEQWTQAPPLPMCSARDLWELGVRPGDKVLSAPGCFRGCFDEFFQTLGLIPVFVDTWMGNWAEVIDAIRTHRPTYGQLIMPILMELERLEDTHDMRDVFSSFIGASFAGQPLGPRMAAKIKDEWGLEVFEYSSAGDTGTAWECREHDGFHLWEDLVVAESLIPGTDDPAADGDIGQLVATDLDAAGAPLIRFRSDDLVRLTRATCACGRTHARQWVVGRAGDETIVSGRPVVIGDIAAALVGFTEVPEGLFQIVRTAREVATLRVRVGYEPAHVSSPDDLYAAVLAALGSATGVPLELELATLDDMLARATSVAKLPKVVSS